ncbi:hypothetical protein CPter91_3537 [Collimonas pratensis]|uniref:Uncharacterized protein n=1 Tax=Collimonas pratensis TaxID=279113 RepID=A0A127Q721_9BURK|nr:hypothetical protein CPter91_3537 [Collimonas pratensis]
MTLGRMPKPLLSHACMHMTKPERSRRSGRFAYRHPSSRDSRPEKLVLLHAGLAGGGL